VKIGIDISLAKGRPAGIGRYSEELLQAFARIGLKGNSIVGYSAPGWIDHALWLQAVAPFSLIKDRIDRFHSTNLVMPLLPACPTIVTVHDLSTYAFPETHTLKHRLHMSLIPYAVKHASTVIVPTSAVADELLSRFKIDASRVAVVHEGVNRRFRPVSDRAPLSAVKKKYGLPDEFILYVGTLEPRKNINGMFAAFALVRDKMKGIKLVIAGKKGWRYGEIFQRVSELGLAADVVFPGYVDDEDLVFLYNCSRAFVYPSFYEGFGLPVLEAMACGIPVVASDIPAVAEVAGGEAMLVPPGRSDRIAEAMLAAALDDRVRGDLSRRGRERASRFTWEKCAEQTLEVYLR